MAQGMAQRNREIAQAMTAAGYPLSEIARLLGLSDDDVSTLLGAADQL